MILTRRSFGATLTAATLTACAPAGPTTTRATGNALPPDLRPVPNPAYDAWVAGFRARTPRSGLTPATLEAGFRGTGYLPGVVTRDRNQTEFRRSLEDYLSIAASDERIAKGRAAFARHQSTLTALQSRYGVDARIITAIWGLESFYGERRGNVPVVSATSTLAFDGRRDIWSDDPTDALASAAAYLQRNGWTPGLRWGAEVTGAAPPGRIIQPQPGGPRFAITGNFDVIKRYNNSDAYAIGVGHLANRIDGAGPLQTPFPPDTNGLTKTDRIALQEGLTAAGFDTQGTDGVIGPNTRAAIRAYQSSRRLPVTGEPSRDLLPLLLR